MKKLLNILILTMLCVVARAQSPFETLMQVKGDPAYAVCSAKNASAEKARYLCMQELVMILNKENTSADIIRESDVAPHAKELTMSNNGITEVFLYVKKSDVGTTPAGGASKKQTAQETPAVPAAVGLAARTPAPPIPPSVRFGFTAESYTSVNKAAMEQSISKLLTAINKAYASNTDVDVSGISITADCKMSLSRAWKHKPYFITAADNVKPCYLASENMNVRDIPIYSKNDENHQRQLSIAFNKQGQIECIRFAAETASYDKIMKNGGREITDAVDAARRTSILSFVENYRMYYVDMDIQKIENIFADNAIIVTGSVITVQTKKGDNKVQMNKKVVYKRQNRDEYIAALKVLFDKNKSIDVQFNDIRVVQDPDRENIYGVTLKQAWDSESKKGSNYHDDGYVFLLWDFQNPERPQIHVRTWQPVEGITKKEEIFGLNSFVY